jgi:outer membrane protein assembly factor BamB
MLTLKKIISGLFFLLFFCFPVVCMGQPTLDWQVLDPNAMMPNQVERFGNSIYIAGGNDNNGYIAKYSVSGEMIWNKVVPSSYFMAISNSELIYFTGLVFNAGLSRTYLGCLNADGEELWNVIIGNSDPGENYARDIITDPEGNVYICGYRTTTGYNYHNLYVAKYSASGVFQWDYIYDYDEDESNYSSDEAFDMQYFDNKIYVVGFSSNGLMFNTTDYYTLVLDSQGAYSWSRVYNHNQGYGMGYCTTIDVDPTGVTIAGSYTPGINAPTGQNACLKYDLEGNSLWQKFWNYEEHSALIKSISDGAGGSYLAGIKNNYDTLPGIPPFQEFIIEAHTSVFLAHIDNLGNTTIIDTSEDNDIIALNKDEEGNILLLSSGLSTDNNLHQFNLRKYGVSNLGLEYTLSIPDNNYYISPYNSELLYCNREDSYYILTNIIESSTLNLLITHYSTPENISNTENLVIPSIYLYPNPAIEKLYIMGLESNYYYAIYSMDGRILLTGYPCDIHNNGIDISQLLPGAYIIKTLTGSGNHYYNQFIKL